ncbi:MAG: hypothetical protein OXG19_08185 [Chloroflexi bacterium]|nr:hypothetical protein [Chloroflexota bacterium]
MALTVVILLLTAAIGSWLLWQWWVGALAGTIEEDRRVSRSAPATPAIADPTAFLPVTHRTRVPSRYRFPFQAA